MKKVVGVKFCNNPTLGKDILSDKTYTYFTLEDFTIGDLAVVAAREWFQVAQVVQTEGFTEHELGRASKWVVQRLDTTVYNQMIEKQRLIQEIRNKLNQRKRDTEDMLLFQQLANVDPEIRKLLDRLEVLDPTAVPKLPAPKRSRKK